MSLRETLRPLIEGDLLNWSGLAPDPMADYGEYFGRPVDVHIADLGYYPAQRLTYKLAPAGTLVAWFREARAVMVESPARPSADILSLLGPPCRDLPQEIRIKGAYAHERIYCKRGLMLTVAKQLAGDQQLVIARVRGIEAIAEPNAFGPQFYKSLDDQISWQAK